MIYKGVGLVIFMVFCGILEGCATVRTYPICSWREPLKDSEWTQFRENTTRLVNVYLNGEVKVEFSSNNRVMVARGHGHELLGKAWPRIGCIGDYQGPIRFNEYAVCVRYIEAALANDGFPPLGTASDFGAPPDQLFCK